MKKRIFALMLSLLMIAGCIPGALASEEIQDAAPAGEAGVIEEADAAAEPVEEAEAMEETTPGGGDSATAAGACRGG